MANMRSVLIIKSARVFRGCFLTFLCFCGLVLTQSVKMQRKVAPPCTALNLRIPKYAVAVREPIALSLDVAGAKKNLGEDRAKLLTYKWMVSEAIILNGQGTPKIVIDAVTRQKSGVHDIPIEVEVKGVPPECANKVTSSLKIDSSCALPTKIDEYGDLSFKAEKSHLDNLAQEFKQGKPDSVVYILAYAGRTACIWEANWRANRAERYLIENQKVPENQIIVVDGVFRDNLTIQLFLSPSITCGPLPVPTLATDDAQIRGPCSDKYEKLVYP